MGKKRWYEQPKIENKQGITLLDSASIAGVEKLEKEDKEDKEDDEENEDMDEMNPDDNYLEQDEEAKKEGIKELR